MKETVSLLAGAVLGLAVASVVYGVFFYVPSPYAGPVVSGVTLIGFGLAIGGYAMQWKGARSKGVYFAMGVGIGIVVVAFVGAGTGAEPYIPS